jgi:Fe-S oxidoreductase
MLLTQESRTLVQKCSTCHDQCMAYTPELTYLHSQSVVTSRKAQLIDFVERGLIDWDEDAARIIYSALNSGLQKYNCIFTDGIDEADYIREVRSLLVKQGKLPKELQYLSDNLKSGSIYGENIEGLPRVEGQGKAALVFEGASRIFTPNAVAAAQKIFKQVEKDGAIVHIPSCGFSEWDLGFEEESKAKIEEFVQLLTQHDIEIVVAIDPAIVYMLRKHSTIPCVHFSQYIESANLVVSGENLPTSIVYHDSSLMSRYLNITEDPRETLGKACGHSPLEFSFHHEQARPSGGRFGYLHQKESVSLAQSLVQQANTLGAEIIVTSCPFSYSNLGAVATDIQVMDYAEFMEMMFRKE